MLKISDSFMEFALTGLPLTTLIAIVMHPANWFYALFPIITGMLAPVAHQTVWLSRDPAPDPSPCLFVGWFIYLMGCLTCSVQAVLAVEVLHDHYVLSSSLVMLGVVPFTRFYSILQGGLGGYPSGERGWFQSEIVEKWGSLSWPWTKLVLTVSKLFSCLAYIGSGLEHIGSGLEHIGSGITRVGSGITHIGSGIKSNFKNISRNLANSLGGFITILNSNSPALPRQTGDNEPEEEGIEEEGIEEEIEMESRKREVSPPSYSLLPTHTK